MIVVKRIYSIPKKYKYWKPFYNRLIKFVTPELRTLVREQKNKGNLKSMAWSNPMTNPINQPNAFQNPKMSELILDNPEGKIFNNEIQAVAVWSNIEAVYAFYESEEMIEFLANIKNAGFELGELKIKEIPENISDKL